jgi:hypothetical protein
MRTFLKRFGVWFAILIVVAVAMSIGQWLTAPEGYGADAWAHGLSDRGHTTLASILRVAREIAETPFISRIVNSSINAPRDRLLRSLDILTSITRARYMRRRIGCSMRTGVRF